MNKKSVLHVQSCCFANLSVFLFCCPRWRRRRRCLSSLKSTSFPGRFSLALWGWGCPNIQKTSFPAAVERPRNNRSNSVLITCHHPDMGTASGWLKESSLAASPIRNTTYTWVVTNNQYGISALVSQTTFRGETSVRSSAIFSGWRQQEGSLRGLNSYPVYWDQLNKRTVLSSYLAFFAPHMVSQPRQALNHPQGTV